MANLTKEQRAARQAEELQKQQAEQQQLEQQRTELDQHWQEQEQQLILQQEQLAQDQQQLNQERQQLEQDRQKFDDERNLAFLQASLNKPVAGEQSDVDANGVSTFTPSVESAAMVTMVRHFPEFPGGPTEARVHSDNVHKWIEHGWLVVAEG